MILISHTSSTTSRKLNISGSKSESNRWLILNAILKNKIEIRNIGNAKDIQVLQLALETADKEINIGHAGTAMRFLTAYFAIQPGRDVILTGSSRMQERPIKPLVEALNSMGAEISYLKNDGYPPLLIKGKTITKDLVEIQANISSQYITALMLIAPSLPNGLTIQFLGELTSRPYVEMTKSQLEIIGIDVQWENKGIQIQPFNPKKTYEVFVESDWSSASYWYSMVALNRKLSINLCVFKKDSLQGDIILKDIYLKYFGIETTFNQGSIQLSAQKDFVLPEYIELNLNNTPDIAQTILITCAGLGVKSKLTGLKTLKVKETDRLLALQIELKKIGVETIIDDQSIEIIAFDLIASIPVIETYHDHRMAMSFAPLSLLFPIKIEDPNVVEKSYPKFWKDMKEIGFSIENIGF